MEPIRKYQYRGDNKTSFEELRTKSFKTNQESVLENNSFGVWENVMQSFIVQPTAEMMETDQVITGHNFYNTAGNDGNQPSTGYKYILAWWRLIPFGDLADAKQRP